MNESIKAPLLLIYDKQCPICDRYCRWLQIRNSIGELKLINAREDTEAMAQITAQGLDIDQGMVLKMDGVLYYGTDAIHALALISSRSSLFNRVNYHIFKSKRLSAILYPLFRFCRKILLRTLGVKKINNLNLENNEHF